MERCITEAVSVCCSFSPGSDVGVLDAKTQGPQVSILRRSLPWLWCITVDKITGVFFNNSLSLPSPLPPLSSPALIAEHYFLLSVPSNINLLSYSIASHSNRNLMKASNLGVVFGPTLMRPERESVASIVDLKYQNIIVEMMISEMEKVSANHFVA